MRGDETTTGAAYGGVAVDVLPGDATQYHAHLHLFVKTCVHHPNTPCTVDVHEYKCTTVSHIPSVA
jgi:hypothetical protein